MTYIRRLVRGANVYLYEVTSYRDKETGKVRQKSVYRGKEIVKDNTVTVRKPRNRITARKVLDSAPYIIYRFAEGFGMQDSFISALDGFTNIREAARRIVILAARSMTGSYDCTVYLKMRQNTKRIKRYFPPLYLLFFS